MGARILLRLAKLPWRVNAGEGLKLPSLPPVPGVDLCIKFEPPEAEKLDEAGGLVKRGSPMEHRTGAAGSRGLTRAGRTLLVAGTLLVLELGAGDREARAESSGADLSDVIPLFNGVCGELSRARDELRAGQIGDDDFADRVLDLFVTADSLRCAVSKQDPASRRAGGPLFAIDRALRFLVDSLRENYVGIVAQNGVSFVAADRALQAAVAWRSGIGIGLEPSRP